MNERLKKYLDTVFAPYEESSAIREIKGELYTDLQEKLDDLRKEGYDEEAAFKKAVESIGEISEIMETIQAKTQELQRRVGMDFTMRDSERVDFRDIKAEEGKFNYSSLEHSNFTNATLTGASFKCSSLEKAIFDGANLSRAKFNKSSLEKASLKGAILTDTELRMSSLAGAILDGAKINGAIFKYCDIKGTTFNGAMLINVTFRTDASKAIFDGATMDRVTYVQLASDGAKLDKVTVI